MFAYNCEDALPAGHPPPLSNYTVQQHPAPYGDHLHTNKEPVVAPPPILRQSSIANFKHTITQSCDNQCTKDSDYHQQPDPVNSDPDELPEPGYVPIRRTKQANVILPPPAAPSCRSKRWSKKRNWAEAAQPRNDNDTQIMNSHHQTPHHVLPVSPCPQQPKKDKQYRSRKPLTVTQTSDDGSTRHSLPRPDNNSSECVELPNPEYVPRRQNREKQVRAPHPISNYQWSCKKSLTPVSTTATAEDEERIEPTKCPDCLLERVHVCPEDGSQCEDDYSPEIQVQPEIYTWLNDFSSSGKEAVTIDKNISLLADYRRERLARINSGNHSLDNMPPNPIIQTGFEMHQKLASLEWSTCIVCNERWLVPVSLRVSKCKRCLRERKKPGLPPMFSAANDMHASPAPLCLQVLNQIEQACVARLAVVMRIYRVTGGGMFMKGHCISFNNDLPEFAHRLLQLPPLPNELPIIAIVAPGQPVPIRANRDKILTALLWLKQNNPYYEDLEIDTAALELYPDNDNDLVQGIQHIEDPGVTNIPVNLSTVYTDSEHEVDITYSTVLGEVETESIRKQITNQVRQRYNILIH